jgi:hypothetical protein
VHNINSSQGDSYDQEDDFDSEEYVSEDGDAQNEANDASGKTKRDKRRRRHRMAALAEWAKMPTTWDQVDLESDKKFFNLVEGEAEENRLN